MQQTHKLAQSHLLRQVRDPILRAKLTADYAIGCKRLLISSDYYPALAKPHVNLVTDPISRVRRHRIVTAEGEEIAADAILFGTGFDAQRDLPASRSWDGTGRSFLR